MLDSTLSNFEFVEWLSNTLSKMGTNASTTFTLTISPSQPNIAPGGTPPAAAKSTLDIQVQRSTEFLGRVRPLLLNGSLYNTSLLRELLVFPPISSSQFIVQRKSFTTSCTFTDSYSSTFVKSPLCLLLIRFVYSRVICYL